MNRASVSVEERVALICEMGCARTREVMAVLREGGSTPETENASESERQQILSELTAIMSVYDAR